MDVSIGTDIVSVERIVSLVDGAPGERFVRRWFTPGEINYCQSKAQPALHFAARLAAKEAVAKSLRSPWEAAPPWRDIEVIVSEDGVPRIQLSGEIEQVAARQGVGSLQVSMSHCQEYATATAVCVRQ